MNSSIMPQLGYIQGAPTSGAGNFPGLSQAMVNANMQSAYPNGAGYSQRAAANDPLTMWQNAYNEAKKANESRYTQGLAGWTNLQNQANTMASGVGQNRLDEINRQYTAQQGGASQDLTSRGLANSTILPSVRAGIDRQRNYALNDANSQILQQRLGILTGLGQGKLDYQERRNDLYPDIGQLAALYGGMGQGNMMGGGGRGAGAAGGGGAQWQNAGQFGFGLPNFNLMGNAPPQHWQPFRNTIAGQNALANRAGGGQVAGGQQAAVPDAWQQAQQNSLPDPWGDLMAQQGQQNANAGMDALIWGDQA